MELTVKQLERLDYRRKRLLERVGELERMLSGRDMRLPPLARTEESGYSEERAWALVEALLAALEQYERYRAYGEDGDPALSELPYQLPEGRRNLFRGFLYCAVRLSAGGPDWLCETRGTFDDLSRFAEGIGYADKIDLCFDELYHRPEMDGFFAWMDSLYEAFTGQEMETIITEEERRAVRKRYQAEIEELEAVWAEQPELSPEEWAELDREWYESLTDEERRENEEELEEWEREERERRAWIEAFPKKETLCQQYLLFRKLYFEEAGRLTLSKSVERLLDIYLHERGKSLFLEDETFFYTYALLNKVIKQVGKTMGMEDA